MEGTEVLRRVPIRWRLTLAFAAAAALVLLAMSVFLALSLRASLDDAIRDTLATRAREVGALVARGGALARPIEADEGIAQLVRPDGSVASTTFVRAPLLDAAEVKRALAAEVRVDRRGVQELGTSVRLVAVPVDAPAGRVVLVVAASLGDRDDALGDFVLRLLVAAPLVLLLVSAGGYLVAAAALRPVDRMRAEADGISGVELGRRLSVPQADDEIARLGDTLNDMLDRLDAAIERERRFVADASHELRTPLAALTTELDLALRRPRGPEELEAALRSAAEESDRLTRLADGLLLLARADGGELAVRRTHLDVPSLLETVARRFRGRAAAAGRSLAVEGDAAATVTGDTVALEQALGNLVDNALRHGDGAVTLTSRSYEGSVELHVTDQGDGFPPSFLPRAFDRFSRGDRARPGGGTGLGLAIVSAVAGAHGGAAHAANRAGGADVWIALPIGG
jgi:heavy metal sensor kinase